MTLFPAVEADLPHIVDLVNRCHAEDGPNIRVELEEFRQELNSSLTRMSRDVRVHRNGSDSGAVTGVVWTIHLPSSESPQRCDIEGYVDPTMRGRGLGRQLLSWGIDHARELLTSVPGHPARAIRTSRTSTNLSAAALHRELGFTDVRWFDDLERSLVDIPTPVRVPGITIEPWPSDDECVRRVKNAAFADNWGSVPTTIDGWREMVHGYAGRPDLSSVARDRTSGDVVGLLLTRRYPADDAVTGRREAWINTLGTLSSHRGRGVATALLIDALHRYRHHGMTHAMIGVDADNPSGAHRLYRSLGFSDHVRLVTSEIVLS